MFFISSAAENGRRPERLTHCLVSSLPATAQALPPRKPSTALARLSFQPMPKCASAKTASFCGSVIGSGSKSFFISTSKPFQSVPSIDFEPKISSNWLQ